VPALRAACLDTRRHALATLLDLVANADAAAAPHALVAFGHMPALEDCTATERLAGRQPRPATPDQLAALETLERRLETARARADLGQQRSMVGELVAIADGAAALDYQPLVAEALDTAGRELQDVNDPAMVPTLRRALWAAQAGGDDRELSDVAIALVNAAVATSRPVTERDDLRAQARAAVARLRWRKDPAAAAAEAMLASAEGDDDLARGSLEAAEVELRRAVDLGVAAFDPGDPRVTRPRAALAKLLEPDEAESGPLMRATSLDADGASRSDAARLSAWLDAAWKLYSYGRDEEALGFVHKARALAESGKPSTMAIELLDDLEAELAVRTGDLAAARRFNERALTAMGAKPVPAHVAGLRVTQAEILEAEGKPADAAGVYRSAAADLALDRDSQQFANLGLVRCLAATGHARDARELLEHEVARGLKLPRERPRMLKLLAELRWSAGEHGSAVAAARDGLAAADQVPALTAERDAVVAWLVAHGAPPATR
jgi:hypothetical protein